MRQRRRIFLAGGQLARNLLAKILSALLASLILMVSPFAVVQAGPKVIEESFRLTGPGDSSFGVSDLALDGNRLAVISSPRLTILNVWVYERTPNTENQWSAPIHVLQASAPQSVHPPHVALQGNILAVAFPGRLIIAERSTSGWSVTATVSTPPGITDMGSGVEIDNGTIVVVPRPGIIRR